MNAKAKNWHKPLVSLVAMSLLAWFSPRAPLDPWNLLSPKRVATMIFALTLIQVMGTALAQFLGARAGAILTGFLGGLISSTATTAALARQSKSAAAADVPAETLMFLSATAAMLFEGVVLLLSGTTGFHYSLIVIFLGPILVTAFLIFHHSRELGSQNLRLEPRAFLLLPILKLAAYIVGILILSKLLQSLFGQAGLLAITFLVSLFEIHGSVIANVQLHDAGAIGVPLLGALLATSIVASYSSKLFLVYTLGSKLLKSRATKATAFLFLGVLVSWLAFGLLNVR